MELRVCTLSCYVPLINYATMNEDKVCQLHHIILMFTTQDNMDTKGTLPPLVCGGKKYQNYYNPCIQQYIYIFSNVHFATIC